MARGGAVLAMASLAVTGAATAWVAARPPGPYLPGSLAPYEPGSGNPLRWCLRRGYAGIELPVSPGAGGELYVGRGGPDGGGRTPRRHVLEPLLRRGGGT